MSTGSRTLWHKKVCQNKAEEKMLIAIQQRKSDIIGTRKHISRGGLESFLQPT